MQQIASKQPDSAASILPLDPKAGDSNKSAFHEALDLHQDSRENALLLTNARDDRRQDRNARQDASNESNASLEQSAISTRDTKNSQETIENKSLNRINEETNTLEIDQDLNKDKPQELVTKNTDKDNQSSETEIKTANSKLAEQEIKNIAQETTQQYENYQQSAEFDFVSYVSKVVEFESGKAISDAYERANLTDKNISADAIEVFDDLLAVSQQSSLESIEQNQVKLEISLEELQLLLDLQVENSDASKSTQIELSVVDEEKVQALISSMLLQLQKDGSGKGDDKLQESAQIIEEITEEISLPTPEALIALDQTLLKQIIGSNAVDSKDKASLINNTAPNVQVLAQINAQASAIGSETENNKTQKSVRDVAIINDEGSALIVNNTTLMKTMTGEITNALDTENIKVKKVVPVVKGLDSELSHSKVEELDDNIFSKISQIPNELGAKSNEPNKVIISLENTRSPLQNTLALDEEKLQAAVTNLKERLENTMQALKVSEKGNEFIAALQAGVKELKQQLSQGREPGIDLNALAEKALSSAAIESDQAIKLKVEEAVKQVNAVLNLANSINSSSAQLQTFAQNFSNNDTGGNISQVEGTKIANGVNATANTNSMTSTQQAVIDRAINIFKADGQQQLAEKVRWMVNAKNATAEIRLDPPDLGGMQIKVNLSGDSAQVNFSVQSNAAKDALDQAVPRLREMLQEQGIELGESSVEQGNDQQQFASNEQDQKASNNAVVERQNLGDNEVASDSKMAIETPIINQRIHSNGIAGIDYYA